MKVFVNARFLTQTTTGVQQFAIELSRHLQHPNIEFVWLAPACAKPNPLFSELNCKAIGIGQGYFWEQVDLPLFLAKSGNPLLLNFCNTAPLVYKNQVVTIHDVSVLKHPEWYSKPFAKMYQFLLPRITQKSKHILTVSETVKTEISEFLNIKPNKICVLFNGVAKEFRQEVEALTQREETILTVGSINPRKNLQTLIDAFIETGLKDYKLVIIGGKDKVFADENSEQTNPSNIAFTGYLTTHELAVMYQKAKLFVSLSHDEGFGIPVLEALHFGCPVLLSDIAVYRELFTGNATFVDGNNAQTVAKQITPLVQTNPSQTNFKLLENYDYALSAKTLINLLLSLAAK